MSTSCDGVFVHELAVVEQGADVGAGTKVWRFAHVRSTAKIGRNCILANNVYVDVNVTIGDNVKLENNVSVYNGVTLEDDVFVGPHVTFTNDRYPRAAATEWDVVPTIVRRGASIGANATIVCGLGIGEYAMVAAGAVVTRDVAPHALVRGNPARQVGYVCVCGRRLGDGPHPPESPAQCHECGRIIDLTPACP